VHQLGGERTDGRDRPRDAWLRSALGQRGLADAEAEALDLDAPFAQPGADVLRQHRQLVRPHAVGNPQHETAVLDGDGLSALGDARAHGIAPQSGIERWARAREAVLPRPAEDGVERFRFGQWLTGPSPHPVALARRRWCVAPPPTFFREK
jgi:hypothetical protein